MPVQAEPQTSAPTARTLCRTGPSQSGAYDAARFDEPTLDQLLADPLICQVMQSDGWALSAVRALLAAAARAAMQPRQFPEQAGRQLPLM